MLGELGRGEMGAERGGRGGVRAGGRVAPKAPPVVDVGGRGGRFDNRRLTIFWDLKTISSKILSDFQGKFALKICFEKALKIIQKALNFKVCETEIKRYEFVDPALSNPP